MEEFSVLRTPIYPKYSGSISQPHYSDRYGYAITYYEPVYDVDLKIPGLGIAEVPFVPIQHIRSNRGRRPFVPRYLTEEDMIQINLRAARKAKDIMKDFHPAQKATYESARDFRTKKEIESRMEEIRESCANVHNYYRKVGKYDFTREKMFNPATSTRFVDKDNLKDVILDAKFENIADMKKKLGEDKNNRRDRFKMLSAGCKKDPEIVEDIEGEAEAPSNPSSRRTSRQIRADQLKALEEKIRNQETASDSFEKTFDGAYRSFEERLTL